MIPKLSEKPFPGQLSYIKAVKSWYSANIVTIFRIKTNPDFNKIIHQIDPSRFSAALKTRTQLKEFDFKSKLLQSVPGLAFISIKKHE